MRQLYHQNPLLKTAIDYADGLKSLAEWCLHCTLRYTDRDSQYGNALSMRRDRLDVGCDAFVTGLSEAIFNKLDAADENPQIEQHNRERIRKFFFSDAFFLFLQDFFDQHALEYNKHLAGLEFSDVEPLAYGRGDAICARLTP